MGQPKLAAIPAVPEELAISAVLETLRDDPTIGTAGSQPVTILAPEGDRTLLPEVMPAPNADQLPAIRLTLGDYSMKWEAVGQHRGKLPMVFEVFSPGTHYADRFRLTSALIAALFPQDPDRKAQVKSRFNTAGFTWINTGEGLSMGGTKTLMIGDDQYCQRTNVTYWMSFDVPT
jgi:hypothetical protein